MADLRSGALSCLLVALYVHQPAQVVLITHEAVRLNRAAHDEAHGWHAQRHGELIREGTTALALADGVYFFRTQSDISVQLAVAHAVSVWIPTADSLKDPIPPPPPPFARVPVSVFSGRGFEVPGRVPVLTVAYR
jgi:hypothetical protein